MRRDKGTDSIPLRWRSAALLFLWPLHNVVERVSSLSMAYWWILRCYRRWRCKSCSHSTALSHRCLALQDRLACGPQSTILADGETIGGGATETASAERRVNFWRWASHSVLTHSDRRIEGVHMSKI